MRIFDAEAELKRISTTDQGSEKCKSFGSVDNIFSTIHI